MYKETITIEEISELPLMYFEGTIHTISDYDQFRKIKPILDNIRYIGFDTEAKPSFKKGQINNISLLQFSTEHDCYLIRINKLGLIPEIVKFLEDPRVKKIGVSLSDDVRGLQRMKKVKAAGVIELQDVVKKIGIQDQSLKKIVAIILGGRISKRQQLSNWEGAELTQPQKIYAATDAWTCIKIYNEIKKNYPEVI